MKIDLQMLKYLFLFSFGTNKVRYYPIMYHNKQIKSYMSLSILKYNLKMKFFLN